jgi:hypothetical protein
MWQTETTVVKCNKKRHAGAETRLAWGHEPILKS